MTMAGKALTFPVYSIVDVNRCLPNFLLDRSNPEAHCALIFSTAKKAIEFADRLMICDRELRLNFSIIQTENEFRGILIALSELLPALKWVHLDPADSGRRAPRRWAVQDLIDLQTKKG